MMEILWYLILGISALFYVVLDGFDLGVGALHLLVKTDEQRRILLNSIGPVWDGNEVWIVIVIGGLFAGFPGAYATVFSGFYTLMMFLLLGLMFRAAAIEFRSKGESKGWRSTWDVLFSFSSILVAFVLGVLLANLIQGIELDENHDFTGSFWQFFTPYSILLGITANALFAMHGAIYLCMKTAGETYRIIRGWILPAILVFVICYLLLTIATVLYVPHMTEFLQSEPRYFILPLLAFVAIACVPFHIRKNRPGWAFISSCSCLAFLLLLFSFGTFPYLVPSTINPETNSLTIYNAASSRATLKILLTFAAIGVPLVLAYGYWVYRTFRGKVEKLHSSSY
jgi:cytochrome d ubiquinol oxidase subunit II